jgi:hypothetical protein
MQNQKANLAVKPVESGSHPLIFSESGDEKPLPFRTQMQKYFLNSAGLEGIPYWEN